MCVSSYLLYTGYQRVAWRSGSEATGGGGRPFRVHLNMDATSIFSGGTLETQSEIQLHPDCVPIAQACGVSCVSKLGTGLDRSVSVLAFRGLDIQNCLYSA